MTILGDVDWYGEPPGELTDVDPSSPDVEVLRRATIAPGGRLAVPGVRLHASPWAGLWSPGWVVGWARPAGASEWCWALLVWLDKRRDVAGPQQWRTEWLVPNMRLVKPMEREDRREPVQDWETWATSILEAARGFDQTGSGV